MVDFSGIMPNPTYAKAQEGAKLAKECHVDFILAWEAEALLTAVK